MQTVLCGWTAAWRLSGKVLRAAGRSLESTTLTCIISTGSEGGASVPVFFCLRLLFIFPLAFFCRVWYSITSFGNVTDTVTSIVSEMKNKKGESLP